MVAFLTSVALLIAGVATAVAVGKRRPVGKPLTWGEGMLAGVFVFGLFLLAYAVVPNQWLLWADNELNWRPDAIGIPMGPLPFGGKDHTLFENGIEFFGRGRILVTKQTVRDVIVTLIYVVMLGANIALWSWWNRRGKKKEVPVVATSTFGRPLVRRA